MVTKNRKLKIDPLEYLKKFGETKELRNEEFEIAEQYLPKVLHDSTNKEAFNQLRFELYIDKIPALVELPPTFFSLAAH